MDIRLNTPEQEELFLKNQKLVFHIAKKFVMPAGEFEDIVSIGKIGLAKAVSTFDKSKGITFSTYACRCIQNEILMHFRSEKKHQKEVFLDDTIDTDRDGNELTLEDTLYDPDSDFTERIAQRDIAVRLISIILNLLEPRKRLIMLYKTAGLTQPSTAKILNISRSYVSRIETKAIEELKQYFSDSQKFKEVFKMEIVDYNYIISFGKKDINNFNQIFATFLKNSTSVAGFPDFKVVSDKERIIIFVPAHPESFYLIAQIIKEIDNSSSNK